MRSVLILLVAGLVSASVGCSSGRGVRPAPERVIASASPDDVLVAAAQILHREFGRVAREGNRRLVTAPQEYSTVRDSGTTRDLYGGRSTMRRSATLEVGTRGDETVARLRVDVEREDTNRQQVMHYRGHRLTDNPGAQTPITHDAATTTEQNTVWTFVRQDRRLARALLEELQEVFARKAVDVATPVSSEAVTGAVPAETSSESSPQSERKRP